MKTKTDAEVIIDGKRYNLSGYESEEYLQKIASYLNGKNAELKGMEGYRNLDVEMKTILMQINIADDLFKARTRLSESSVEKEATENEIFNLKHDIIELQKQLVSVKESCKSKYQELSAAYNAEKNNLVEEQKKNVRLETENEALKVKLEEDAQTIQKLTQEIEAAKKKNGRR